jgi:hypothetical protein
MQVSRLLPTSMRPCLVKFSIGTFELMKLDPIELRLASISIDLVRFRVPRHFAESSSNLNEDCGMLFRVLPATNLDEDGASSTTWLFHHKVR